MIKKNSENISIEGWVGTWYVIDSRVYNSERLYLLQHEKYGDMTGHLIVTKYGNVILDDVWNGFDDYDEAIERELNLKLYK